MQNQSPPKIGPARPILVEKPWSSRPLLLPKVVRPDQFWQPKPVSHGGPILAENYLPKSVPTQSGTFYSHACIRDGFRGAKGASAPLQKFFTYMLLLLYTA